MFAPYGLLEQGPEAARAFLAQVGKAGIDHVCCGDHVSFGGAGFDGLVQAAALDGGYVCGRIAAYLNGPATVTPRRPLPLATPLSADVWYPGEELAGSDGCVRPEFLRAALDCAGGIGALGDAASDGQPIVLGRLSARQIAPVRTRDPYVVVGWRLAGDGRKMTAGSALLTAAGQGGWRRARHVDPSRLIPGPSAAVERADHIVNGEVRADGHERLQ